MRQNHLTCGEAVCVDGTRITPDTIQEAMNLALRMVESARAGPPVGSAVNGFVTVMLDDALQFVDDKGFGYLPADGDKFFTPA